MEQQPFKFQVGDKVKDQITGFTGIVIARVQWLTNCNTYTVKPQKLKDGKPMEGIGFDEPNLILIEAGLFSEPAKPKTGGPTEVINETNRL